MVWGLKSSLRERLTSLLGIAEEKRENSFIRAVNEMSFAIPFHGRHVADPQHPGVAPPHTAGGCGCGCYFGGGFGEGEKCTKALKRECPVPRAWGQHLPWVLLQGKLAQCPLPAQGTRLGGIGRDLAEQHTFSVGSGPRNIPGFYFSPPILTYLYPTHCT